MPQDAEQGRARSKRGLVENAGGMLACPVCHSPDTHPRMIRIEMARLSVLVNTAEMQSVAQPPLEADDPGYGMDVDMTFGCANRHWFSIRMRTDVEGTATVTEWLEAGDDEP
jgi:hypothetical protein